MAFSHQIVEFITAAQNKNSNPENQFTINKNFVTALMF